MGSHDPAPHPPLALYLHIPFCETKCNYCNFNTYAHLGSLVPDYVEALAAELEAWGRALTNPPVTTAFLGGGTPSWLSVEHLGRVTEAARGAFSFAPDCEFTAEANPGDVSLQQLERWRAMGINRISIGVQSFDDSLLGVLSRRHSAAEAAQAYRTARAAGFANVNLDLMYGLPGQSLAVWKRTLEAAIGLDPPHLSLYALTIEEGTPLWRDVRDGRMPSPDPDLAADMYALAEEMLDGAAYRHYEISNWARAGYECRHNLAYWRNEPFLGVGPGAHSYLDGRRFWNIRSPAEYVRRLSRNKPECSASPPASPVVEEARALAGPERLSESIILGLRLDEGVGLAELEAPAGRGDAALRGRFLEALHEFVGLGLVSCDEGRFRLTRRGRLLSNEVFVRLLPD
ncbi:MAG: radical SAM family heme chaperone HemW [Dehalococcoidia bacterium]